ncbi:fasciclin domain-containing protein [Lentiprolixibacter aurantiacus]|uniref:Fasciclin domain-containing protein n=1 Tax=Lentiprolixibacter aurantiacus TaxID=2993939 RepID=A0AAE3MLK3_9FLAO|nr:fasciclin domain-containing protein [Lentiprolixibacter aurantiacus]MCX2719996.1 fasciclin domain-containing protein [Lentiprolixibacter aurantiacus]
MKKKNFLIKTLVAVFALVVLGACSNDDDDDQIVITDPTIVDLADANDDLSILVDALTAADLVTTLQEAGPFTVLAPTNTAFQQFLTDNGFAGLGDIPSDVLRNVLLNHVIVGTAATSGGLTNSYLNTAAQNADGDALSIYINTDSGVTFNGVSSVIDPDIEASNGIIHVVDAVIGLPDVTTFAVADPNFATLVAALTAYPSFGYVSALQTPNGSTPAPFTVFAPTNEAFGDLLADLGGIELGDIDEATLSSVLELHVLAANNVRAEDLAGIDGANVPTLGGEDIVIDATTPAIIGPDSNGNTITATNVQAMNGVIHAIGRVIR